MGYESGFTLMAGEAPGWLSKISTTGHEELKIDDWLIKSAQVLPLRSMDETGNNCPEIQPHADRSRR
mgnify:CR=1 FL=1